MHPIADALPYSWIGILIVFALVVVIEAVKTIIHRLRE